MVLRRCRFLLKNEDAALDAMQDTFLKLMVSKENLEMIFPSSLIYTIATNLCLNRIKREGRYYSSMRKILHTVWP